MDRKEKDDVKNICDLSVKSLIGIKCRLVKDEV